MTLKTLAAAACISLASATTAISAPITLDFSFAGVTGTFFGLDDADGSSSATSLDLSFDTTSTRINFDHWSVDITDNAFLFFAGDLEAVDFQLWDYFKFFGMTHLEIDTRYVELFSGHVGTTLLETSWGGREYYVGPLAYMISPVSAVPLPAGGLLLLSAFGGVAALKRRKKRAA